MQVKADTDFLRYVIENDHCYTPLTYADEPNYESSSEQTTSKKENKNAKNKAAPKVQQNKSNAKKSGRSQATKQNEENDEASASNADDTGSGLDDDRAGSDEEGESDSELSDFSLSESDNDRDSDLDFSVNDYQSRRTRKIKKKKNSAKILKKLGKKQRNADNDVSDDSSINQKKSNRIPKKSSTAKAAMTTSTPTIPSTSTVAKAKKEAVSRLSKTKENSASEPSEEVAEAMNKIPENKPIPSAPPPLVRTPSVDPALKCKPVVQVKKDKKAPAHVEALFTDMSSLFSSPDVIKKVGGIEIARIKPVHSITPTTKILNPTVTSSGFFMALSPNQNQKVQSQIPPQISVHTHSTASVATVSTAAPSINVPSLLASEQDKQLDLIDSLVQEELLNSTPASPTKTINLTSIQQKPGNVTSSDIPNIVKMLENPEVSIASPPSRCASNLSTNSTNEPVTATNSIMQVANSLINDPHMLPDDLLEGFANSDDLTEDLLQHVAQLVEDRNVQEVLDKQVFGVTSGAPYNAKNTVTSVSTPVTIQGDLSTSVSQSADAVEKESPFVRLARQRELQKAAAAATPARGKEPLKIVRSNGRVIILPPIEAPTTRSAKRKIENPPSSDKKIKSPDGAEKSPTILQKQLNFDNMADNLLKTPQPTAKLKERRSSVAVKRVSADMRKRSLSTTTPPTQLPDANDDDYDDDEGSDESYNSEDDPNRYSIFAYINKI